MNEVVWASGLFLHGLALFADIRAYLLSLPVSALVSSAFTGGYNSSKLSK